MAAVVVVVVVVVVVDVVDVVDVVVVAVVDGGVVVAAVEGNSEDDGSGGSGLDRDAAFYKFH